jgi:pyruvate kinase
MRKTKIICTLGPSCDNKETIRKMLQKGMDVARFNFSHGDYEEHKRRLKMKRRLSKEEGLYIPCIWIQKGLRCA